jgi:integrase
MRTSDLHAWRWEHIDTTGWTMAKIRRPKTRGLSVLQLGEPLREWLKHWWTETGSRRTGAVFSVGRGDRAEEARGHTGYARQLRAALLTAGITRAELHSDGARADVWTSTASGART